MTLKEKVAILLADNPELREKKAYLQTIVWHDQSIELGLESIEDFLVAYQMGDLHNAESIRRVACKLMEEYPELQPTKKTKEKNEKLNEQIRKKKGEL